MVIVVTNHALKRLSERLGLSKMSAMRIAERAFEEGIKHSETRGNLNKWVTSLYFVNKRANNIRLYGDKAFIFIDNSLITILQIPHNLMKEVNKIKARK